MWRFIALCIAIMPVIIPIGLSSAQMPSATGPVATMGAGTYPRAIVRSDNTILGSLTSGSGSDTVIKTVQYNGANDEWSDFGEVGREVAATHDFSNNFLHQLPNGHILCAFRNHDRPSAGVRPTYFRIVITTSTDNGKSWSYLSTPEEGSTVGLWEPFLINALDGSLQLYYSREYNSTDQDNVMRRSTDGGQTWESEIKIISGDGLNTRDGMVNIARFPSGSENLVAIFEVGNPTFSVKSVSSPDDGVTWGNRQPVYNPPSGKNAGAPGIAAVGSTLVASFGTDESGGSWANDGAMKLLTTNDTSNTKQWGNKTTVHDPPAQWSSVLSLGDNSFLAMYETGGTSFSQNFTVDRAYLRYM